MTLNKPIYVGCTVLELSKLEMYKFHYDVLKKKCKKYVLLFTDTDSLFYEVDEDFYEIMHQHKELFNLNNFLKNNKYFCNDNKKVLGKMKDEYGGTPIYQFIGLRSKIYSIRDVKKKGKSTHQGHNSYISNDEYYDTLFNKKILRHKMTRIKSRKHKLFTYKNNETSTSCFDDKRYILIDGINTLS